MTKKHYRIYLFEGANSLCETLATLAAKANGGQELSISDLSGVGKADKIKYPSSNEDITVEPIGDNLLHVDRKIGGEYKTVLRLELVEIMELPLTLDELDGNVVQERYAQA